MAKFIEVDFEPCLIRDAVEHKPYNSDKENLRNLKRIFSRPGTYYLLKVNNRNTRMRYEMCSKLTIKHQNDFSDVVLVSLLLTWNIFHNFF